MAHKGSFKPGYDPRRSRQREAKALREALALAGNRIHLALMKLVDEGDRAAILYAHQQLVGRAPERIDEEINPQQYNLKALTKDELLLLKQLQAKMAVSAQVEATQHQSETTALACIETDAEIEE